MRDLKEMHKRAPGVKSPILVGCCRLLPTTRGGLGTQRFAMAVTSERPGDDGVNSDCPSLPKTERRRALWRRWRRRRCASKDRRGKRRQVCRGVRVGVDHDGFSMMEEADHLTVPSTMGHRSLTRSHCIRWASVSIAIRIRLGVPTLLAIQRPEIGLNPPAWRAGQRRLCIRADCWRSSSNQAPQGNIIFHPSLCFL